MKYLNYTSIIVLLLTVPLVILPVITKLYLPSAFERYQVYENFPQQNTTEVLNLAASLFTPLTLAPELDAKEFSREDRLHWQDVVRIFQTIYAITAASIFAFVLTLKKKGKEKTFQQLHKASKYLLLSIPAVATTILLTWNRSFILFHEILFPFNDYWQLDPDSSTLINLFPAGIFKELLLLYCALLVMEVIFVQLINNHFEKQKQTKT